MIFSFLQSCHSSRSLKHLSYVVTGSLISWHLVPQCMSHGSWAVQATENGAAAFLGPQTDDPPDPESSPLSVPVIQLPDPWEALGRLGAAFYNEPSQKMTVVGVTGEPP